MSGEIESLCVCAFVRVVGLTKNANSRPTAEGDDKGWPRRGERIFTVPSHRGAFHYCQTVRPGRHNGIRFCNKQRAGAPQKKGPKTENGLNVKWRQCRQHGRRLTPRSPPSRQRTTAQGHYRNYCFDNDTGHGLLYRQ